MNALPLVRTVEITLLAFLKIIEPVVRMVLGVLAFCASVVAFFFRFFTDVPHVPFWGMLAFALGCAMALMGYMNLVRWLSH